MSPVLKIFVVLAFAAAAILSGIATWANLSAKDNPREVLDVFPDHAAALFWAAEDVRKSAKGGGPDLQTLSARLLKRAPLSEAPLVYAGLTDLAAGRADLARNAFQKAVQRQPRNVVALNQLATFAAKESDFRSAIAYLDRLTVLDRDQETVYVDALAAIANDQEGVKAIEQSLASGSPAVYSIARRLNGTSNNLPLLVRLNEHSTSGQREVVQRLLQERGPAVAYIVWLQFLPATTAKDLSWPFDPAFAGNKAPPPFNWALESNAEIMPEGGLYVSHQGRESQVLAHQYMLLGPGHYRFHAAMDGDVTKNGGSFVWAIDCFPSRIKLGRVRLESLSGVSETTGFEFSVPATECPSQELMLSAAPGEFPERAQANVRSVGIDVAGGQ